MKYIPNAMKSDDQGKSSSLILSIIFEIADLDPKLKAWVELKTAIRPIFINIGTQNKSNMMIINKLIGIDDLDPKLQICEIWSRN